MGSLPVLKPAEVCRILERWVSPPCGSAARMSNTATPMGGTTVPMHKGRDIAPPLLRQICRDIGLTVEEFTSRR